MSTALPTTPRAIKIPGPDHPITIAVNAKQVVVTVAGYIIATTRRALVLREASYPAVQYIPREDVDMTQLERSDHETYCPYKGVCNYFSIPVGGQLTRDAVWTYESPYDAVGAIKGYVAFYADRVDSINEKDS